MANKYSDMVQVEHLIDSIDGMKESVYDESVWDFMDEIYEALVYLVDEVRDLREGSIE